MERKNVWLFIILLIPILFLVYGISSVKADSGFDVGYDGGGGYSGGGWSSSDSSWSSSGGGSYSYHSSSDNPYIGFLAISLFILAGFIEIYKMLKKSSLYVPNRRMELPEYHTSPAISDEEIRKYIPDFNSTKFIEDRYQDYLKVQNAWMVFDYETLRDMLTDELYNQYIMQLDSLKLKNKQNIMSEFLFDHGKVTGIKCENDILELTVEMTVSFYDYIVCDGAVERGSKHDKVMITYEMVFITNQVSSIDKCPNCHAEITNSSSQVCEYCRSIITRTGDKWVMSKKINKKQW